VTAHRRRLVLVLALMLPACGDKTLDVPQPPQDLTALADAYAMPTGTIDPTQLQQTVSDAKAQFAASHFDALATLIADMLVGVRERFDDSEFPVDPLSTREKNRPTLQAVVTAQHTCKGWSTPVGPPDATQNGNLELTAVIDDTQLERAIWGTASSCRQRVLTVGTLGVNAFLSGMVSTFLQGPLPADDQQARALVLITGQLGTDSDVVSGTFDFQIVGTSVEFRHPVADGFVIVSVSPQAVSVRGNNGSFTCEADGLSCAAGP